MYVPTIRTRATNVELTNGRRELIRNKLAPLGAVLDANDAATIDIVMRRIVRRFGGSTYCLSVKLKTQNATYIAIAIEPFLSTALVRARESLRRAVSRGECVNPYITFRHPLTLQPVCE